MSERPERALRRLQLARENLHVLHDAGEFPRRERRVGRHTLEFAC